MSPLLARLKRFFTISLPSFIARRIIYRLRRQLEEFDQATHDPQNVQQALLRRILATQADTAFGHDHHMSEIRDMRDFRRQLPVARYEYFEPYIARMRQGELRALVTDPCVHMFALTSGTTAA